MNSNTGKIKGIAARAGHWSATHRKLAIWGWVAFMVVALFTGSQIGQKTADGHRLLRRRVRPRRARRSTTPASRRRPPRWSWCRATSKAPEGRRSRVPRRGGRRHPARRTGCRSSRTSRSPYAPRRLDLQGRPLGAGRVRHHAATPRRPRTRSPRSCRKVEAAQRAHPDLRIEEFGDGSADKALSGVFRRTSRRPRRCRCRSRW